MYAKILVPIDGFDASAAALHEAIHIAKHAGGTIRLLHVVKLPQPIVDYGHGERMSLQGETESLCQNGKRLLNKAEGAAREQGLMPECVMCESNTGSAADVILSQAREWGANLIVMGAHMRSDSTKISPDAGIVLDQSPVPVLLTRGAGAYLREGSTGAHQAKVANS